MSSGKGDGTYEEENQNFHKKNVCPISSRCTLSMVLHNQLGVKCVLYNSELRTGFPNLGHATL